MPLLRVTAFVKLVTLLSARAGILLAVTIIYQYFETYEKEKVQSASLW
jgi:hypothetical protein